MSETVEQWINRNFTVPACRGLAVRLAHAAFQAGGEEIEEFTFEDWMSQPWENSKSQSSTETTTKESSSF